MSLQVWLPLNGNLNNQGLSKVTSTGGTINDTGIFGKCYACSSSSYVTIQNTVTDKYDFSFSFWMKVPTTLSSTGAWNTMFSFRALNTNDSSAENSIGINWASYNNIKIYDDANHQDIWMAPGNQFNYDKWCHYTITHTGNDSSTIIKVYTDGILRGTFNNSHRLVLRSGNILLGSGINPSYGPIYFNDFRLYDHCLSAKEVKEISKGLLCHYKLDNNGFGNPNLCNPSLGEFTGVVPTSSYKDFLEQRAVTTANANDIYMLSYYAKASIDNVTLTNHLYNNASNIVQVSYSVNSDGYTSSRSDGYSLIKLTTSYKKYWVKWVFDSASTSATKDLLFRLQSGLNTSSAGATVTIKNVKLERGSVATSWCPHTSDSLYTSLGLDSTTESDCSGLSNNGTKIGGLSSSTNPLSIRYESCYDFDGNTGSIQIPNLSTLVPSGEFTMNCWIYHDNTWSSKGYETILGGPSGFELEAKPASTNSPSLYAYSWGQGQATYELNKWNMITMTRNASESKFYVNGELKITGSAGSIPTGSYFIGAWRTSSEQNYKGRISDFRLYSTVLPVDDIKELYNTSASIDKNGNMYAYEFKER